MDNDCAICLENKSQSLEDNIICNYCNTKLCFSCMDEYCNSCGINYLPVCTMCKREFFIDNMPQNYIQKYSDYIANYLSKNPNFMNKITDIFYIDNIILTIRK